jgi:hypothetical protein
MNNNKNEKGQIIIILALGLVAILGFTALALDGSMIYKERRADQSTADSAALAGAGAAAQSLKNAQPTDFYCGGSLAGTATEVAILAAMDAAQSSAIVDNVVLRQAYNETDFPTGNGVLVSCKTDEFGSYLDVRVMVSTVADTNFARVVGTNQLSTRVEATARVYPRQPAAYGNAIVSLSNSCGPLGGIDFGGNSTVHINYGGVFSNSCLYAGGSTAVTIEGGTASYYSTYTGGCPGAIVSDAAACPIKVTKKLPSLNIKVPQCTNAAYVNAPSSGTMNPGNYKGISAGTKDTLILNPGLYCLKGDLSANADALLRAEGVTFYMYSGGVHFNGTAEIHLLAATCEPDVCGVPGVIPGLLMYIDPANQATVILNGSSENEFQGTIYGPSANFKLNGSADNTTPADFNTQIIGNKVEFVGDVNLMMNMKSAELYQQPAWIELLK